jgi:hypothetical protein
MKRVKFRLLVPAIFLGLTTWMYVNFKISDFVRTFKVPVAVYSPDKSKAVVKVSSDFVLLRLKGPKSVVEKLEKTLSEISLKPSDKLGMQTLVLTPDLLGLPKSVTLLEISPASIDVEIDLVETKTVSINPVITGNPPSYVNILSARAIPSTVKIKGPREVLSKLSTVETVTIPLDTIDFNPFLNYKLVKVPISLPSGLVSENVGLVDVAFDYQVLTRVETFKLKVPNSDFKSASPKEISIEAKILKGFEVLATDFKISLEFSDFNKKQAAVKVVAPSSVIGVKVVPEIVQFE